MAIVNPGQKITAAHFTGLRARVNAILGDAGVTPSLGYGQTLTSSTASLGVDDVTITKKVKASQWIALRNDIVKAYLHQFGVTLGSGALPIVTASTKIAAAHVNAFDASVTAIEASPLTANVASMSVITLGTSTNGGAWGGTGATTLTLTKTFTFSSVNAARYFFNSGGVLRYELSHPTGATVNGSWNGLLLAVGTIAISALGVTATTGTGSLGYYGMTGASQTIFTHQSGAGGSYGGGYGSYGGVNQINMTALKSGATITITTKLIDGVSGNVTNNVTAGTAATCRAYKAVTPLVGIETPTISSTNWVAS